MFGHIDPRSCSKCGRVLHVSKQQREAHNCPVSRLPPASPPVEALTEEAALKRVQENTTAEGRKKRRADRETRKTRSDDAAPPGPPLRSPSADIPVYNVDADCVEVMAIPAPSVGVLSSLMEHRAAQKARPFFPFGSAGDALLLLLHTHLIRDGGRLSERSTVMFGHLHNFLMEKYPTDRVDLKRALRAATLAYVTPWPAHQVVQVPRLKEKKEEKDRLTYVLLLDFMSLLEEIVWTHGHLLGTSRFCAKFTGDNDRIYSGPQQGTFWECVEEHCTIRSASFFCLHSTATTPSLMLLFWADSAVAKIGGRSFHPLYIVVLGLPPTATKNACYLIGFITKDANSTLAYDAICMLWL